MITSGSEAITGDGISKANAHLISAAPDLLEACKVMAGWLTRLGQQNSPGLKFEFKLDMLRAAIAKATVEE